MYDKMLELIEAAREAQEDIEPPTDTHALLNIEVANLLARCSNIVQALSHDVARPNGQ